MLIRSNKSRLSTLFHISLIFFFTCFPGLSTSAVLSLGSMEIYNTHEWFKSSKPTVYFHCKGENNKTILPDVKEVNVTYSFNGDESWQPLTEFTTKKCKRCGFYEQDTFKSDDVYEEWEFCPSEFEDSDGTYKRSKKDEYDATFLCQQCVTLADTDDGYNSPRKSKGMHILVIVLISTLVSTVLILGSIVSYKYWLKKRREQEQARFLKLFEDGDDIEDDLELDTTI
ncbi:hypothetical protein LINGRAHAP2_LOCUS14238 [Linum grandiflorum]